MMGHGFFGGMWLWPLIFILVVVACVAMMSGWMRPQRSLSEGAPGDVPTPEILRKRYASGEITREEFERMKKDIG